MSKQIVLITGCSDGGLGSSLALAFHRAGYRVIATARNLKKLTETRRAGIEELELDVLSQSSIKACAEKLDALTGGVLDILINNAGAGLNYPVVDIPLDEIRNIFELNTFSLIPVTRAFLPALMKSKNAKVANNISVAAYTGLPIQGAYNASKAAANGLTETLRLELAPFGIKVVALMTGSVKTKFFEKEATNTTQLPDDSIYRVVPGGLKMMQNPGEIFANQGQMDADVWASQIVKDLSKANPAHQLWRGDGAGLLRFAIHLPIGMIDNQMNSLTKMDEVYAALKQA